MKQSEAVRLATKLVAFFPQVPADTAVAYASKLEDLDVGDTEVVLDYFIEGSIRFPSVAEIRNAVLAQHREYYVPELPEKVTYRLEDVEPETRAKVQAIFSRYFERHPAAGRYRGRHPGEPDHHQASSRDKARLLLEEAGVPVEVPESSGAAK